MESKLLVERDEGIAVITFNRPKVHNALDMDTVRLLKSILEELAGDDSVKVLIITGAGDKAFISGADVQELKERTLEQWLGFHNQEAITCIERIEKPVIAAINGYALGGGTEVALVCDIRIASERASFGQPEVKRGVIPGSGATQRLPRLVGKGWAKYLIYTGEIIDAHQALRIGLVEMVVPHEDVMSTAKTVARKIMKNAPIAIRMAKRAIDRGFDIELDAGLAYEKALAAICLCTEDRVEGASAFLEKREPVFKGR